MTLRIEAGDRASGSRWLSVRDPTGSPEDRNASTRCRNTSARPFAQGLAFKARAEA